MGQSASTPTVFVVDDDDALLRMMELVVCEAGYQCVGCRDGQSLLDAYSIDRPGCLVLDMLMPQLSGLAVQERLRQFRYTPPIIMMSGGSDVLLAVDAMKQGAFDYLRKPFSRQQLLEVVERAIEVDRLGRLALQEQLQLEGQLKSLTAKEREVLALLLDGLLNKQIARHLAISVRAVELRRASIFRKMQVTTIAGLLQRLYGTTSLADVMTQCPPAPRHAQRTASSELSAY